MGELSIETELALNLVSTRMKIQQSHYNKLLRKTRKVDKKETETLMAGYKKCLADMDNVLRTIVEM